MGGNGLENHPHRAGQVGAGAREIEAATPGTSIYVTYADVC